MSTLNGKQGFGNAGFQAFFGLTADSSYTVSVELECKDNPGTFSQPTTTNVTTYPASKPI